MKRLGWTILVIGGAVGIALGPVYGLLNPELTQAQVFLENWSGILAAALLILGGRYLVGKANA